MADEYISRKQLLQELTELKQTAEALNNFMWRGIMTSHSYPMPTYDDAVDIVSDIPAADVVERKRGEWLNDHKPCALYQCSVCKDYMAMAGYANCIPIDQIYRVAKYCPNCGAEMRQKREV